MGRSPGWSLRGTTATRRGRRLVGLVAPLVVAVLTVSTAAGLSTVPAAAAPDKKANKNRTPVSVLDPRPGAVIVRPTAAEAHTTPLNATVSIPRRDSGLGLSLNGHPLQLPAQSGQQQVSLDAAAGLVVGENLLVPTVDGSDTDPTVPFVVGYRDTQALGVDLQLGQDKAAAATLTLRVPTTGIDRLSATLNGAPLTVPPKGGPDGKIVLDLAELGTVHWGSNSLQVQLIMTDGRVDDWSRTFELNARRNVASARVDGAAVVGGSLVLDSSRSLIAPGASHDVRWALVRRPLLSHASLGSTSGVRVPLQPDVPGTYQVALTVGSGAQLGYDLLTVSVTDPDPLVPLDTIAYRETAPGVRVPGVTVGKEFYEDPSTDPKSGGPPGLVQVLVLARSNLEFLESETLNSASDFQSLAGYLQRRHTSDLVIVTHPSGTGALPANGLAALDTSLHVIGGSLPAKWTLSTPHCWSGATDQCTTYTNPPAPANASWQNGGYSGSSFSVIGVPGMQVGQAWRDTAVQTGAQEGRIVGYLTEGTDQSGPSNTYTVINGGAEQYEAVNTCVGKNCEDVEIGYPGSAHHAIYSSPGENGFHVVVLDRTTLAPILNRTVNTQADLLSALTAPGGQQQIGHAVGSMNDQRLVIIQSVGDGYLNGQAGGGPTSQAPLLQYMDELGGTPDLLLDSMTGHFKYALVGAATNLPWRNASAVESSTEIPGSPPDQPSSPGGKSTQTGKVSGVLQLDRTGLYAPLAGDPAQPMNADLYRLLYEPAQPWPYADDTDDLHYIADQLHLSDYPDIRSAYYENLNGEQWSSLHNDVKNVDCPRAKDACGTFDALKAELSVEFDWVGQVKLFGDNLRAPFTGSNSLDIRAVYNDVKASLPTPVPDNQKVTFDWLGLISDVSYLGGAVATFKNYEKEAAEIGLFASATGLATWVMDTVTGSSSGTGPPPPAPADTLTTTADDLAQQLNNQALAYQKWVGQMQEIVLYDYGKLSQVGEATKGNGTWKFGADYPSSAIDIMRGSTRAAAYSALVPAIWPGYNLKPYPGNVSPYSNNAATLACDYAGTKKNSHGFPFEHATQANQFWWAPTRLGTEIQPQFQAITTFATDGGRVDQAWVFAQLDPGNWADHGGSSRSATLPATDLTHYIYGAQSNNLDHGAYQFAPTWWRNTYNPPSHTICWRLPDNASPENYWSTQYPPPNIPAPAP